MNLIIVADRGGLKAFKTSKERDEKGIELVEEFFIEEDRGRYKDKVTDQASRFRNWGSTAEKGMKELEKENRACRTLIKDLEAVLKKHQPSVWDFAASSDINGAILDHLEASSKAHLRHNLKKDLMKTPQGELVSHFEHA